MSELAVICLEQFQILVCDRAMQKSNGFSVVEILVATGILGIAMLGAISVTGGLEAAKNGVMGRSNQLQTESLLSQVLASPAACKIGLVDTTVGYQAAATAVIDFTSTQHFDVYILPSTGGGAVATRVFQSGQVDLGATLDLTIENPVLVETVQAGTERPNPTKRYLADLKINRTRVAGANTAGPPQMSMSLPISIDLDPSRRIFACTVRADNIEDTLYAPVGATTHSVRDCLKYGGLPYPTEVGLICRFPVTTVNQPAAAPPTYVQQAALTCPTGWTLATVGGIPMSATLIRDQTVSPAPQGCAGDSHPQQCLTAWHTMGAVSAVNEYCDVSSGGNWSGGASNQWLGGATLIALGAMFSSTVPLSAALVGTAFGTALTTLGAFIVSNPVGWVIGVFLVLGAIFGGSGGSCDNTVIIHRQYSQPLAVGCW